MSGSESDDAWTGVAAHPKDRRSRWKSYNQELKEVHLPSALESTAVDYDLEDTESHFHTCLSTWRELNLAATHLSFSRRVEPMCRSMALLLHNWEEIVDMWMESLSAAEEEALQPLLDMMNNLTHDLRTTLLPKYPLILSSLTSLLTAENHHGGSGTTAASDPSSSTPTSILPTKPKRKTQLPALTLQTFLTTLSSLLRYIVTPTPHLLRPTFLALRQTMISIRGRGRKSTVSEELERMLAEVWGGVLRRVKGKEKREGVVRDMIEGLEGCEDGIGWVWCSALKAPSQTLHPSTSLLFPVLLSHYTSAKSDIDSESIFTLLRRVLTSFIHHVKDAQNFAIISDLLLEEYKKLVDVLSVSRSAQKKDRDDDEIMETEADHREWQGMELDGDQDEEELKKLDRITRIWKILVVVCATRKGSRLSPKQIPTILSLTTETLKSSQALSLTPIQKQAVLELTVSALQAGDTTSWLSAGRGLMAKLWELDMILALRVSVILTETGWTGWKVCCATGVLKNMMALLAQPFALSMFAYLNEQKRLDDAPQDLRRDVSAWAFRRLEKFEADCEDDVLALTSITALSSFFPFDNTTNSDNTSSLTRVLIPIIDRILIDPSLSTARQARQEHEAKPSSGAWILSTCFKALSDMVDGFKNEEVDLVAWTKNVVEAWAWHEGVLKEYEGLVSGLVMSSGHPIAALHFAHAFEHLRPSLLSPYHGLRLASIRFLLSPLVSRSEPQEYLLFKCLDAENCTLDYAGVKERIVKLGLVVSGVPAKNKEHAERQRDNDTFLFDIALTWLVAQLKVNIRPLWAPAVKAIGSLIESVPEKGWEVVIEELSKAANAAQIMGERRDRRGRGRKANDIVVEDEEEKEVGEVDSVLELGARKHCLEGLGVLAPEWPNVVDDVIDDRTRIVEGEKDRERIWNDTDRTRLRGVCSKWTGLDEDALRSSVVKAQLPSSRLDVANYEAQLLSTMSETAHIAERHNAPLITLFLSFNPLTSMPRHRMSHYFSLFAKFRHPSKLHASATLYALYTTLLSEPDRPHQKLALTCLYTYNSPTLRPYKEKISKMLDEKDWRDALAEWSWDAVDEGEGRAEVVGIVTRVCFGLLLNKKGASRARTGDRRSAILSTLGSMRPAELGVLVDLMLGALGGLDTCMAHAQSAAVYEMHGTGHAVKGQMTGFLTLLGDVLRTLGTSMEPFWPALFASTLEIAAKMQGEVDAAMEAMELDTTEATHINEEELEPEVELGVDEATPEDADDLLEENEDERHELAETKAVPRPRRHRGTHSARSIRSLAFKRLDGFFNSPLEFNYRRYMPAFFATLVTPRLPKLKTENMRKASPLIPIFVTWSKSPDHVPFLQDYDADLLPSLFDCLGVAYIGPDVSSKIFDIVEKLMEFSTAKDFPMARIIMQAHTDRLLVNLYEMMERATIVKADDQLKRQIRLLSSLASYITDERQASRLLALLIPPLQRSTRTVREVVKTNLLRIIQSVILLVPEMQNQADPLYQKTWELLSGLFSTLREKPSRDALVDVFNSFAALHTSLAAVQELVAGMNAWSDTRMTEPDFNRRLAAFGRLNDSMYAQFNAEQWLPLAHNAVWHIQDPEELAIRNAATYSVRRFIERSGNAEEPEFGAMFTRVVYPGLLRAVHSKAELVRIEVLGLFGYAAEKGPVTPLTQDLKPLLMGGDREADFFLNIIHIQMNRRFRALRRLGEAAGSMMSSTLTEIFLPVLGHIIIGAPSQSLAHEAIITLGQISANLEWNPYRDLFQQYLRLAKLKDSLEAVYIRAVIAVLDNFHFSMEEEVVVSDETSADQDESGENAPGLAAKGEPVPRKPGETVKIANAVTIQILPKLLHFIERRDEAEDTSRIPMALGIVKVALHLPLAERQGQISRLLTILCQTLKSRSLETRFLARDTLKKVAVTLGPEYLATIIKELRIALTRGPALHILATVVHSIIKHVTSDENRDRFKNLDDCVEDIGHVASEVVFGQSGEDTRSDGFHSSTKEVSGSSNRGQETFMLLTQYITPRKISCILEPIRKIMHETVALRMMTLVDEILRRIALGLNANKIVTPADILSLCHSLVNQNSKFLQQAPRLKKRNGKVHRDINVDLQVRRVAEEISNHFTNNSFRFVVFGLEIFNTGYRRGRFNFNDPDLKARLEPFVSVIGNVLYSSQSQVLALGLRSTAAIMKCPLEALPPALPAFVKRIVAIIQQAGNTESDVAQTALKTLTVILRDSPKAEVKEADLTLILGLVSPDIEDSGRQETAFNLLRSIVVRKLMVSEVYDLMDRVAQVMVTSQSSKAQALCREVYLIFVTDYPQGKVRLQKTMQFLAQNLAFVHESGRKSVMELLSQVFETFRVELLQEHSNLFFMALVMVLANDDSAKCREMAATLLKTLFQRMTEEQKTMTMKHVEVWSAQDSKPPLRRVALLFYGLAVDVLGPDSKVYLSSMLDTCKRVLEQTVETLEERVSQDTVEAEVDEGNQAAEEWQLAHQALTSLKKALRVFPDVLPQYGKVSWREILSLMTYPHSWVRVAATRLVGILYTSTPIAAPDRNAPVENPLSLPNLIKTATKLSSQLHSSHLDATMGLQIVKNLFYIGRCFYLLSMQEIIKDAEPDQSLGAAEGDKADELDDDADSMSAEDEGREDKNRPLSWLFSKASGQLKLAAHRRRISQIPSPNWSEQPCCVVRWFAAMVSHMDEKGVDRHLLAILTPLYRIVDMPLDGDKQYDELKTLTVELQELIQNKIGSTRFSLVYNDIRQSALATRRTRKADKAVAAATNPEVDAERRIRGNVRKLESRKRKIKTKINVTIGSLSLSQVDRAVQTLMAALDAFRCHIKDHISRYNIHRNTIASKIYQLPIELLSRIFLLSVPLKDWSVGRLKILAQVSKRWKDVVTGTPELWAVAKMASQTEASGLWITHLDLALRKSRNLPLTVYHSSQEFELDSSSENRRDEEFIDVIGRHAYRWRSTYFEGLCSPNIVSVFERPSPALTGIDIKFVSTPGQLGLNGVRRHTRININPQAQLCYVAVDNAVLGWRSLSGIRTLRVYNVDESLPQTAGLLHALSASPQLELLELSNIRLAEDLTDEGHVAISNRVAGEPRNITRLHFPSLTTLRIHQIHPSLFQELTQNIDAPVIRCSSFNILAAPGYTMASPFVSHILEKVAAPRNWLGISVQRNSVKWHSEISPDGGSQATLYSFDFELSRAGRAQVFGVAWMLTAMARLFDTKNLAIPLRLKLGPGNGRILSCTSSPWSFILPFSLLEAMTTLTELQIYQPLRNASSILKQLSTPMRNEAGELLWPCPHLVNLYVEVLGRGLEQQLLAFIGDRCRHQQSKGYPGPIPLSTLTLRVTNRDAFANLVGVGQVVYVDW
ncbi:U3 snoRNP protein [Tulasnella sp. 330]|nr:U3 snoRNP protein [Tulasnella sp. 330]